MARLLALEWDTREARMAVAAARGGTVVIEEAFAVPLPPRAEGQAPAEPRTGETIREALAARRLGRAHTLVAVGRPSIELKLLSLPPAPADELPELVRFQALREFTSLGDGWPLDFLPLGGDAQAPRQVLAAAISPELVAQIQDTCSRAGVTPARLVLRPCAAASLLARRSDGRERVRLLVDVLADEADLTVLVNGQVVFLRTARMPGDMLTTSDDCRPLLAEIRRTIAAVQNQLGGEKVEAIHLCGSDEDHLALARRIEAELGLPTTLFDPFAGLALGHRLHAAPPQRTGRFAPLVGMLLDEAQRAGHAIDFLNPRRRAAPPNRRRKLVLSAVAVGLLAAVAAFWTWLELERLEGEIARLSDESKAADKVAAQSRQVEQSVKEIEKWTATDIVWLDELRELSADFPAAEEALLTQLRMGRHSDRGEIELEGLVRTASTVDKLEAGLRDGQHRVEGRGRHQDSKQPRYLWHFASTVVVASQDQRDYRERAKKTEPGRQTTAAAPAPPIDR